MFGERRARIHSNKKYLCSPHDGLHQSDHLLHGAVGHRDVQLLVRQALQRLHHSLLHLLLLGQTHPTMRRNRSEQQRNPNRTLAQQSTHLDGSIDDSAVDANAAQRAVPAQQAPHWQPHRDGASGLFAITVEINHMLAISFSLCVDSQRRTLPWSPPAPRGARRSAASRSERCMRGC